MKVDPILKHYASWYQKQLLAKYPEYYELNDLQLLVTILCAFEEVGIARHRLNGSEEHWEARPALMNEILRQARRTVRKKGRVKRIVCQL